MIVTRCDKVVSRVEDSHSRLGANWRTRCCAGSRSIDSDLGGGMAVSVGRIRACHVFTHRFVALGHNTVRGAAGASILNAELMLAEGAWLS